MVGTYVAHPQYYVRDSAIDHYLHDLETVIQYIRALACVMILMRITTNNTTQSTENS